MRRDFQPALQKKNVSGTNHLW